MLITVVLLQFGLTKRLHENLSTSYIFSYRLSHISTPQNVQLWKVEQFESISQSVLSCIKLDHMIGLLDHFPPIEHMLFNKLPTSTTCNQFQFSNYITLRSPVSVIYRLRLTGIHRAFCRKRTSFKYLSTHCFCF